MSSRRKSRPVRRLHSTNGELLQSLDVAADANFEEQTFQGSLPTPENSPENNRASAADFKLCNSEEQRIPSLTAQPTTVVDFKNRKRFERPPEGVFIVQPQGVSDDEGQEVKSGSGLESLHENETEYQNPEQPKKRQLNGSEEMERKSGLDLSVKRRKTEEDISGENSPNDQEIQKFFPTPNYQTNMRRFENFVQLFAAKHRSFEENSRNSLLNRELEDQQRIQKSPNYQNSNNQGASLTTHDKDERISPTTSSNWENAASRNHTESWDEKHAFSNSKSSSPTETTFNPTLTPAVAAAMMASIASSNADIRNFAGSNPSSEVLQNLFKQRSLQQQTTPQKQNSAEYSTSPDAMDTITAGTVSSGVGSIKRGTLDPTNFDEEVFDKYISRFNAKKSCMQQSCPHINRDHFHCTDSDCNFQRFTNKSDVIRHYNMHKKRDNSLAHGFMRFAPTDNCQNQFGACHLNGKSTHYHCLHPNCSRVYTSTSDVMTHENFHKKNQHFATNGFQRYRATENCDTEICPFRDQRTTHFHCTRKDCNFTFKNKCDIDKHKAYHMRDDAYTRQGFKKFYKNEACGFRFCAWNRTANHFHCLRTNCQFSFTSTGQMVSHKRKHDRQDMLNMERSVQGPAAPMSHEPTTSMSSNLELTSFQEAARKVLAAIPSSVAAAALPRGLGSNFMRTDSSSLPFSYPNISTQSAIRSNDNNSSTRQERTSSVTSERPDLYYDAPPPPYIEVSSKTTTDNEPSYSQADRHSDDDMSEKRNDWPTNEQGHSSATSPMLEKIFSAYNQDVEEAAPSRESDDQVLNLSSKNTKQEESGVMRSMTSFDTSTFTSPSLLKFFRGYSPNECKISNCVFVEKRHFHCVVDGCNATFVDRSLVITHTLFHEKLERIGVKQLRSSSFPFFYPSFSRSNSAKETTSPPPGYIALPISSNKQKEPSYPEKEQPNLNSNPSSQDHDADQCDESARQDVSETSPQEEPDTPIPTPQNAHSAVYEYISRIINENKSRTGFLPVQQSISQGAMMPFPNFQTPAMMAPFSRSQSCSFPLPQEENEILMKTDGNLVPNDGYVHVRAGSACIRPDCKYVLQSHWHCTLNRCRYVCKSLAKAQSHRQAHDSLEAYARAAKECFKSYTVKKQCPYPNCEFRLRGHYHCLKPGCHFVTIGTSKLPWHMKKHEKIAKREASGFKYYTKKDQCGRRDCKYNEMFSHYHCIRAGCSFAFQYKHQMSTHVRKHIRRMLGRSYSGADVATNMNRVDHTNVDSGDESLPLIVDEADEIEQRPGTRPEASQHQQIPSASRLSEQQLAVLKQFSKGFESSLSTVAAAASDNTNVSDNNNNHQLYSNDDKDDEDEFNGMSNDDMDANSTNDEVLDLRAHNDFDSNSNSSNQTGFANDSNLNDEDNKGLNQLEPESHIPHSSAFLPADRHDEGGPLFSKFRLNNDVMSGFRRFEISESCGEPECQFSQKVSHYHCLHEDCTYRFTGRTHMFKHRQHHERVASLVRDDFKRFKATQNCLIADCSYNGNSTHFHCLRCSFKCTDSAKVGAHRRQHVKSDTLEQSGFERFRGKEDCGREACKYRNRNTSHFHCLQQGCNYAVVGLSGIEQHANKHKRLQTQTSDQVNFSIITNPLISQTDSSLNTSIFADSSLLPTSSLLTYSVPFTALTSATSEISRVSNAISPVTEEQPSATFVASLAGPQLEARQIGDKPDVSRFINLAQLGMKREIPGGQVSAGFNM